MRRMQIVVGVAICTAATLCHADSFGSGALQFSIEFVPIVGDASSANGTATGWRSSFADPASGYRVAVFEVTNSQWSAFENAYGPVDGQALHAYDRHSYFTGPNLPVQYVSWYEAAQFVNWLNVSTGHQPAYRFTGTQGTSDYTFATWDADSAEDDTNVFRHKDARYFLPTDDEWVKAAHWNGALLQDYATRAGETTHQGDGVSGSGWNYFDGGFATDPPGPWSVGSGSRELNGTYDMMGNVYEWTETDFSTTYSHARGTRGGAEISELEWCALDHGVPANAYQEEIYLGFRVAARLPEPSSLLILTLTLPAMRRPRKRA